MGPLIHQLKSSFHHYWQHHQCFFVSDLHYIPADSFTPAGNTMPRRRPPLIKPSCVSPGRSRRLTQHDILQTSRRGRHVSALPAQSGLVWFCCAALCEDILCCLSRQGRRCRLTKTAARPVPGEHTCAPKHEDFQRQLLRFIISFLDINIWKCLGTVSAKKKKKKSLSRTTSSKSGRAIRLCVSFRAPPPFTWTMCSHW